MVAMACGMIADPECQQSAAGEREKVRPCVRCNTCIDRPFLLPAVAGRVNPLAGREAEMLYPAGCGEEKVIVIGGGPAGMEEAARRGGARPSSGSFEKNDQLGGNLRNAAAAPFKKDMQKYLEWAIRETNNAPGLTVRLSTEATAENVAAEKPDSLIIAAGSTPVVPDLPGIDRGNVVWAGDVEAGRAAVGESVVIAGAGLTGSETALHLAQQGKKVFLIDRLPLEEVDRTIPFFNIIVLRELLQKNHVITITEVELEAITDTGVKIRDREGAGKEIPCHTVILSLGLKPHQEMIEKFAGLAPEIHVAGDCNNLQGNLYKAVSEGFFAAMDI